MMNSRRRHLQLSTSPKRDSEQTVAGIVEYGGQLCHVAVHGGTPDTVAGHRDRHIGRTIDVGDIDGHVPSITETDEYPN